jgi:UDP-2,4-diacetamido-2,4,6-trideoxy-beta-L-altropyranose hydrolase
MRVAFRADASLQIGSGHVMRCLTLADALRSQGVECHFICRAHLGNLIERVRGQGFVVHVLPSESGGEAPAHCAWLGATQEQDVLACTPILQTLQPDWLVVDHYALDVRWEAPLRSLCRNLLVIDDLADRAHDCDLLLDQNLGRQPGDYAGLLPARCSRLTGPHYALLRPEFAGLRDYSLQRRRQPVLRHLLISMGGVDQPNATGLLLDVLGDCPLPGGCSISVIMGGNAPWLDAVRARAARMPWPTQVLVSVDDMAQRMADCDLAIGAAGGTAWERCCLGVPSLLVVLAENQWSGARALQHARAAELIGDVAAIPGLPAGLAHLTTAMELTRMSQAASQIADGQGANRVAAALMEACQA